MANSADVPLQAPPNQTFESLQSEMVQEETNTNHTPMVWVMAPPASRTPKYEKFDPSGQGSTARSNRASPNHDSGSEAEGGSTTSFSLNPSQAEGLVRATQTTSLLTLQNNNSEVGSQSTTATVDAFKISDTTTSVAIPTQSTALPVTTDHIPAPENDVTNKSVVNPAQSSPTNGSETRVEENQLNDLDKPVMQKDNGNQRVELVCKRCARKYETDESKSDLKEWLYNDVCTNCQRYLANSSSQIPKNHPRQEKDLTSSNAQIPKNHPQQEKDLTTSSSQIPKSHPQQENDLTSFSSQIPKNHPQQEKVKSRICCCSF